MNMDTIGEILEQRATELFWVVNELIPVNPAECDIAVDIGAEDEEFVSLTFRWQIADPIRVGRFAVFSPDDVRTELYTPLSGSGVFAGTETGVTLTHAPTGLTASRDDGRSQLQNKVAAMEDLRQLVEDHDPANDGEEGGLYGR